MAILAKASSTTAYSEPTPSTVTTNHMQHCRTIGAQSCRLMSIEPCRQQRESQIFVSKANAQAIGRGAGRFTRFLQRRAHFSFARSLRRQRSGADACAPLRRSIEAFRALRRSVE
jgi:hypothetical protein